ncbi:ATP-binding Cassette (ABC) Superfamily [Achlya hypogyna]|uniref:ATP-binding Cassette (ABC) Superfamily n=1 Tax=Achlya hypogyna TaxID=1202772 RepID=A0A1V9YJY7_ACHHY|nr:ATP-binding Cassette (ABC) Superfamily [Achlya hypogyna]
MHRTIDHEVLSSLYTSRRKRYTPTGGEETRPSNVSAVLQSQYPGTDSRRYRPSAHLSTVRTNHKAWNVLEAKQLASPIDEASWIAKFTLAWMNPLFRQGASEPLDADAVPSLRATNSVVALHKRFQRQWVAERQRPAPRLFRALLRTLAPQLAAAFGFHAIYLTINLVLPYTIKGIVNFLSSKPNPVTGLRDEPVTAGLVFAGGLALLSFLGVTILGYAWSINIELSNAARSIVMDQVYLKAVSATTAAAVEFTSGDVITLATSDSERLFHGLTCVCYVVLSPVALFAIFVLIGFEMGAIVAVAGAATMAGFLLSAFGLSYVLSRAREALVTATAARMTKTQELLQSIRAVKLNAYESSLVGTVERLRIAELKCLGWFQLLCNVNIDVFILAPVFTTVVMFAVAGSAELNAGAAFAVVSLMVVARFPCNVFSSAVRYASEAVVSCDRVQAYLLADVDAAVVRPTEGYWVAMENASFSWSKPTATSSTMSPTSEGHHQPLPVSPIHVPAFDHLHNLCFQLPKTGRGSFTVVVGPVGSGKSSFLRAIAGDMRPRCAVGGVVAYAGQEAWLTDDSLRNNILLHRPYQPSLYRRVLAVTGLVTDTAAMPMGDLTVVGERGSALSGGQRARVNLARALYQADTADIFLLDDPLSALDVHVASHVFHQVRSFLGDKQVIMAMNAHHHLLVHASRVVTLTAGTIVGDEVAVDKAVLSSKVCDDEAVFDSEDGFVVIPPVDTIGARADDSDDIEATETNEDAPLPIHRVYLSYLSATGVSPWLILIVMLVLYSVYQTAYYVTDWYLDTYIAAAIGSMPLYAGLALATVVTSLLKDMFVIVFSLRCSTAIHATALRCVVVASLPGFFDVTPLGDVLNRFSSDLAAMDTDLPYFTYQFLTDAFQTLCILIVVGYYTPVIILLFLPCGYLFVSYQVYSLHTANSLKRLDLTSRAPLVTGLTETIDGHVTIQAARVQAAFVHKYRISLEANAASYGTYWLTGTWLEIRLGWLSAVVVTAVAVAVVMLRDSMDAHIAGLVLVYVMNLSANVQEVLRVMGYVQTYMTSVARLLAYHGLPAEVDSHGTAIDACMACWPTRGGITIDNYCMRYQSHGPLVLRYVSLTIEPGEKVGICGRTGSGKSSLLAALMRLVPAASGAILIDGVDVASVPLATLRSRVTVIPQDPVLFAGSLGMNLDPTGTATSDAVALVLQQIHLDHLGPAFVVEDGGTNVSLGQRQLLCFGRALLRRSRIVVLDEATAFVDGAMESVLQELLATAFQHTTMLTIAHRLATIIDTSDKVLVLDAGAVAEFGTPRALLATPDSIFAQLVAEGL